MGNCGGGLSPIGSDCLCTPILRAEDQSSELVRTLTQEGDMYRHYSPLTNASTMVAPFAAIFPRFLDPVLEFLSVNLPSPLYVLLLKVLSHSLGAIAALINLCGSLLSTSPSNWNAQTLLPPIITILAAYLALASLYRTTSWLIRLIFWFMKWGALLGIFMGGFGYLTGGAVGNAVGNQGPIPFLGGYVADLFSNQVSRPRSARQSNPQTRKAKMKKPAASEAFKRHEAYLRQNEVQQENVYESMKMIADAASYIFQSNWWAVKGPPEETNADAGELRRRGSKAKAKAGSSHSR